MRRLARHLFTLCSAISLLLWVALCVLWVRGHWRGDGIGHHTNGVGLGLSNATGRITLWRSYGEHPQAPPRKPGWEYGSFDPHETISRQMRARREAGGVLGFNVSTAEGYWEPLGGDWTGESQSRSLLRPRTSPPLNVPPGAVRDGATYVIVPHWLLVGLTALLPARRLAVAARDRRRRRKNRCPACGYDLRATAGRCPECGAVPEATPRRTA